MTRPRKPAFLSTIILFTRTYVVPFCYEIKSDFCVFFDEYFINPMLVYVPYVTYRSIEVTYLRHCTELGPTLWCQFLMSRKSAVNTYLCTCIPSSFHNFYGRKYITRHWQSVSKLKNSKFWPKNFLILFKKPFTTKKINKHA